MAKYCEGRIMDGHKSTSKSRRGSLLAHMQPRVHLLVRMEGEWGACVSCVSTFAERPRLADKNGTTRDDIKLTY